MKNATLHWVDFNDYFAEDFCLDYGGNLVFSGNFFGVPVLVNAEEETSFDQIRDDLAEEFAMDPAAILILRYGRSVRGKLARDVGRADFPTSVDFMARVLGGMGKRGRAAPIFDFEPRDNDHAIVRTVLSKKLPCFKEFMSTAGTHECEQLYKYIMGEKNHERIANYIINMLPETATIRTWKSEQLHLIESRYDTCEEYLKYIVTEMIGQYKSRAGRWDLETLRIDMTENITTMRNDARLAADASRMTLG
jgi:hypothetical protein